MPDTSALFAPRDEAKAESGTALMPKFDRDGLVTAIAQDVASGEILMVAHMNAEALARTIATGEAWFWSRSRKAMWRKGETSGNTLSVREMRIDCDQDVVLMKVAIAGDGAACHMGYRSCFYRTVPLGAAPRPDLALTVDPSMPRPGAAHGH
jgi:phosphoribosyl-AMP cyclohydrolase